MVKGKENCKIAKIDKNEGKIPTKIVSGKKRVANGRLLGVKQLFFIPEDRLKIPTFLTDVRTRPMAVGLQNIPQPAL